jgi:pimeloyl-ACP methyl ester carboxylesterase
MAAVVSAGPQISAEANMVSLNDNGATFDVTYLGASKPVCIMVFAAGSGGNPERHLPLLASLAEHGCSVVAPHFERLASPQPTEEELLGRARRLRLALDFAARPDLPVTGVGHSIGATILLALAGAQLWLGPGQRVDVNPDERLARLVLMTPPTGFFQAPGALDGVSTPLQVWAGARDVITPPAQAEFLKRGFQDHVPVDLRVIDGAGHFSFMNTLPPQTVDPCPGRDTLLEELEVEIHRFIASGVH